MASSPDLAGRQDSDDAQAFYAELHCLSNFTFLRGASHPQELVGRAAGLGYSAIALTDECSVSGVARAHLAALGRIPFIVGSEFRFDDGLRCVLLATDRASYGRLSHLISVARCAAEKGNYRIDRAMLETHRPADCFALWLPDCTQAPLCEDELRWLQSQFGARTRIAVELHRDGEDKKKLHLLRAVGKRHNVRLCASGDVHMHLPERRILQNTLTAIRLNKPVAELGYEAYANGERYLRSRQQLQSVYPRELLEETLAVARECSFSLEVLRDEYQYPFELVPPEHTPASWLRTLTMQGMRERWPKGAPKHIQSIIEKELALIAELKYEAYFLTVNDIVRYARSVDILCQGRGSAANSVVCFCLGITAVDPSCMQLLFERFVSRERNEPPDIDVDFEHERREEVIQYIYRKYGHERAALAATVITYRTRSAIRDVGKALGMAPDQVDLIAKSITWWD
ncbi:MAG: PHP domain-containing protein, partial [Pseudomonadota bacterium]